MTQRRSLTPLLLLSGLVLIGGAGCASFRGDELAPTRPWPPAAAATKKSVSLILAGGTVTLNGNAADAPPAMVGKWREFVHKTYADSGMFSAVVPEGTPADLRAEVRISDVGEGSQFLAFLSGLTLTIIPATASDRISMRTDFKSPEGDVLASIEKADSMTLWIHLTMIFVMPFKWPGSVSDELFRDLTQATLADARAKGVM